MSKSRPPQITIRDLLKKLVNFFLGKSEPRLEALEEERLEGEGITLVRYRRKTVRAYRTWRLIYKPLEYDIIMGWDTLAYLPDVPVLHKENRLSTHYVSIYKQGLHARYNPLRGLHEPDVETLFKSEVCLERVYMADVMQHWRKKTKTWTRPINTTEDLFEHMIDEVARYAIRHPPVEIEPCRIPWRTVIEQTVRVLVVSQDHKVYP